MLGFEDFDVKPLCKRAPSVSYSVKIKGGIGLPSFIRFDQEKRLLTVMNMPNLLPQTLKLEVTGWTQGRKSMLFASFDWVLHLSQLSTSIERFKDYIVLPPIEKTLKAGQ